MKTLNIILVELIKIIICGIIPTIYTVVCWNMTDCYGNTDHGFVLGGALILLIVFRTGYFLIKEK